MIRKLTLAALAATTVISSASSNELREAGKKISATNKESIVWLSVLSKTNLSADGDAPAQVKAALAGQDKESKSEVTGTVVDASGLIVTALSVLDKGSVADGQTVNTPMGTVKLKATTEIREVKVITADGSELNADLVMKDADLGLAFIKVRPEDAKGVEFKAIDLNNSAKAELLDECVSLSRLDESLNREASMETGEITGITTRPRTFYQTNNESIGCPYFLANGKLLGISVARKNKGQGSEGAIALRRVILPAADVAKVAAQAKDAKAETKPEAKTEDKPAETK